MEPTTPRPRPVLTLAVVFSLYALNYVDRQVLAAVAPLIQRDLGLDDTRIGALQSVFLLCIAGFALPAAYVLDRWSRAKGIAIMALVWSGATALTGLAGSFVGLVAGRALVGIGEAGYSSGGTALLSAAFPPSKRGRALGIFNASIPLGAAVGTILGARIAEASGSWRTPFFAFALPGLLFALAALSLHDGRVAITQPTAGLGATLREFARIPSLVLTYMAFAMNMFATGAIQTWMPTYLSRVYGLDLSSAGKRAGLVMVLALVGAPLGGYLSDLWTRRTAAGPALTCAVTSLAAALVLAAALLLGTSGFWLLVVWGLFSTAFVAPAGAITQAVVGPSQRATAWGAGVLAMYLLGGAWSPVVVGKMSQATGDLGRALLLAPAAGVLSAVFFLLASRAYPRDVARAPQAGN
jgi:MFS family permease